MIAFSPLQREYIRSAYHRWNVKTGATRSGKTWLDIVYTIPKRLRDSHGGGGIRLILGATKGTITRNIIEPLTQYWGPSMVTPIRTDNTATLFGEKVYCLGADNVRQVNRLRGASVAYCYGDEITTWAEELFRMLQSRLDRPDSSFDGTCNPDSPTHWFKNFLDSDADIFTQSYTIDDNPFLSQDFVANLKREYAGSVYYDRFILGKWCKPQGLVYPMFDKGCVVPTVSRPYTRYAVSCDYGIRNPFSAALWGLCDGVWYRVREYFYDGRSETQQLTDSQYYDALCTLIGDTSPDCLIIDPSAASFITLCRQNNRFSVRLAKNDVLPGIQSTAQALSSGRIKFNDCCSNAIREFSLYEWDPKASRDSVIKQNDHSMDDIRYFVFTLNINHLQPPCFNLFT